MASTALTHNTHTHTHTHWCSLCGWLCERESLSLLLSFALLISVVSGSLPLLLLTAGQRIPSLSRLSVFQHASVSRSLTTGHALTAMCMRHALPCMYACVCVCVCESLKCASVCLCQSEWPLLPSRWVSPPPVSSPLSPAANYKEWRVPHTHTHTHTHTLKQCPSRSPAFPLLLTFFCKKKEN